MFKQTLLVGAMVSAVSFVGAVQAAEKPSVEEIYNKSCVICHAAGTAGAPKTGDKAAWKTLLDKKGIDGLVAVAKSGLNAMPPKGLCNGCTDDEFKALIKYMAK